MSLSDLSRTKLRPAVVLADVGRDDWILCQVTSKPYGDAGAIVLTSDREVFLLCGMCSTVRACQFTGVG